MISLGGRDGIQLGERRDHNDGAIDLVESGRKVIFQY
jgi:hypothetical protein